MKNFLFIGIKLLLAVFLVASMVVQENYSNPYRIAILILIVFSIFVSCIDKK